jgi:hypothetical protein
MESVKQGQVSPDQYFATLATEQLTPMLMDKFDNYSQYISATGRLTIWRRVYYNFYKADYDQGALLRAGLNGEYVTMPLNQFKNLVDHLHNLITSQKFSYVPKAVNTDYQSQSASILTRGLLVYFDTEKRLPRGRKRCARFAELFGEGYAALDWDASLGDEKGVLPQTDPNVPPTIRHEGDFTEKIYLPTDVARDTGSRQFAQDWYIMRDYQNKWDLAAKYPALADKIKGLAADPDDDTNLRLISNTDFSQTDLIPVYTFRHDKTPACPDGKYTIFLNADICLLDGPLPYKTKNVYACYVEPQEESCFGYSHLWHLLPLQEQLDNLVSTVVTNQSLAVANILIPEGANIQLEQLAEGMNGFKYNAQMGEIKPLNLVNTPKEVFDMMEFIIKQMEIIAGINSVVRGDVPTNLRSGSALALVAAQAMQFGSGLQESYVNLKEDCSTGIIELLGNPAFVQDSRVALIAGKVNQPLLKQFVAGDLAPISRVQVELANPLAATTAGRVQMAETLIQNGLIKNKEQYLMVMQTGTLEPEIEGLQAELLLIKQENESLSQGKPVQAIKTENHPLHIMEHKAVLCNLDAKNNPQVLQATLGHIAQHEQLMIQLQLQEPMILQILGIPPVPMAMPPGPATPETETPTKKAADIQKPDLPSLPAGSPPQSQVAYEQMQGANPTNNKRAQGAQ